MTAQASNNNWIIQRCTNKAQNTYEAWVSYSEHPMSQAEAERALKACEAEWPEYSFRAMQAIPLASRKKPHLRIPKAKDKINFSK